VAVSNAGGLGVLGGIGVPPDELGRRIARVRELSDRPFGFNMIIGDYDDPASTDEDRAAVREPIDMAIEARVAVIVLFWGSPAPFVESAHRNGVKVFVQVGSLAEAEAAVAAGVDGVIVQGIEAGGHVRGTTSIWELLPAAVQALKPHPVLASGGIGDGAGIARALRLGANGVSLGTRFVASEEAWAHPRYKQRIVESTAADTVYGELFDAWWPDAPHRVLRNKTIDEWEAAGRPPSGSRPAEGSTIGRRRSTSGELQPWPRYATGMVTPTFEGDFEYVAMAAGESCSVVNDVKPAGVIVRDLVREAEAALAEVEQPA
jgi:nitronate monooxygenase